MEAVNDQAKILRDLVEAAMAAANASGPGLAITSSPLATVTAALEASGVTRMVTEATASVLTDAVSKRDLSVSYLIISSNFSLYSESIFHLLRIVDRHYLNTHPPLTPSKEKG